MNFEDLQVMKSAEDLADLIWKQVIEWDEFAKEVVGRQITQAADSIGANIAEVFGRADLDDRLQFLYDSRGSIFETKYWLNRAHSRGLLKPEEVQDYASRLTDLARQLNVFIHALNIVRYGQEQNESSIRENNADYLSDPLSERAIPLFSDDELNWLST